MGFGGCLLLVGLKRMAFLYDGHFPMETSGEMRYTRREGHPSEFYNRARVFPGLYICGIVGALNLGDLDLVFFYLAESVNGATCAT